MFAYDILFRTNTFMKSQLRLDLDVQAAAIFIMKT